MKNLSADTIALFVIVIIIIGGVLVLSINWHIEKMAEIEVSILETENLTKLEMYKVRANFIEDIYKVEDIPERLKALDNK